MPYELQLPNALKRWKVKILDRELLFEEPHVTIVHKTELWRFGLRSQAFLDANPKPSKVSRKVMKEIMANLETLCRESDARFPTNPVFQAEEEKK
jgi:hypothetical protein